MRPFPFSAAALAALLAGPTLAQTPPSPPASPPAGAAAPPSATPPAQPAAPAAPRPETVIAKVDGAELHMSDLQELAQSLPQELRSMPGNMLYPLLLDQLIDRTALAIAARKQGLDQQPDVQRQMHLAEEAALQNALIQRDIAPKVTEEAVSALYKKQVAGKPGTEEVHARHILVTSEEEANKIIAQLKGGADFAALAKKFSTDPGAQKGGDLGWFKQGDMLPEFGAAAFALKPGQFTDKPVRTRFGWHVIQVLEVKRDPPPTYEQARSELRQQIVQEAVQKVIAEARASVKIERFNPDGSPITASETAEPPPPPGEPPAAVPPAENR
jgi:peptidyl-prolyl cis-trans isomerase C